MSKPIAETILSMAAERGPLKTICPSDVSRQMFPEDWRKHMDDVRMEAIVLHKAGKVSITQKGIPVDTDHIKGPIRIRIIE
ncbi:DUF3253 domain-containing protein [Mucilaginibacter sp.]